MCVLRYMKEQAAATRAKEELNGLDLHGRVIRVDYSLTNKAHDPTPGLYMGAPRPGAGMRANGAPGFGGPPPPGRSRSRERQRSRSPPGGRDANPPQ